MILQMNRKKMTDNGGTYEKIRLKGRVTPFGQRPYQRKSAETDPLFLSSHDRRKPVPAIL